LEVNDIGEFKVTEEKINEEVSVASNDGFLVSVLHSTAAHLAASKKNTHHIPVVKLNNRSYNQIIHTNTHTHTHLFNDPLSGTTRVGLYQKGKTNLDFTAARDSEWQWHQLGHMHVCTSLQTDNHASTPQLSFLQARCPSCCPTNSIKALKADSSTQYLMARKSQCFLMLVC